MKTRQVATAHVETNAYIAMPNATRREQSVDRLDQCLSALLQKLLPHDGTSILSVGLTGQMHGVIGLDSEHRPVTNLVMWQDRSSDERLPGGQTLLEAVR